MHFRVPATDARAVTLILHDGAAGGEHAMQRNADATFTVRVPGASADLQPELGEKVTEGRRMEFRDFPEFADAQAREGIPDPQAVSTFEASRLNWNERTQPCHARVLELYRALIALRLAEPALAASDDTAGEAYACDDDSLVVRRRGGSGDYWIVARLTTGGTVPIDEGTGGDTGMFRPTAMVLSTEEPRFAADTQPPRIEWTPDGAVVHFARAGAAILKS